jgi:hypothetical protein
MKTHEVPKNKGAYQPSNADWHRKTRHLVCYVFNVLESNASSGLRQSVIAAVREMAIGLRRASMRSYQDRTFHVYTAFMWSCILGIFVFLVVMCGNVRAQAQTDDPEKPPTQEVHPYLDDPIKHLVKEIPELKGIRPVEDQQSLDMILEKTGKQVDDFFNSIVDLEANEEIHQERLAGYSSVRRSVPIRDNYLILRHSDDDSHEDFDEFRMDENGNRLEDQAFGRGFLVTSGFALICMQFSGTHQWDSRFKYLGEQKVDGRETYVVAYAQIPGQSSLAITLRGPRGKSFEMLTQGIAWVDQQNFHVVRMRTDLLTRQPESGLEKQTTKVDFSEVKLADIDTPFWLPRDVHVDVKLGKTVERFVELEFRNEHRYTDYRRYRVTTKIVSP